MEVQGKIIFEETQQFRVKWVWAIILLSVISSIGITVGVALLERETMKEAWWALALIVPLEAAMLYLFYVARLETIVTSEGVYYRWSPFQRKPGFIDKSMIETAELRPGPSFKYGFHRLPGYGRVHNTAPGSGIQFVLQNGKKLFLGSAMPDVFSQALAKIINIPRHGRI